MMSKSSLVFVVLLFFVQFIGIGAFNCTENSTTFEKIIGVGPASFITKHLLYKGERNEPVTLECIAKCRQNISCSGFILSYEIPACYYYEDIIDSDGEMMNDIETNVAWFSKICVDGTLLNSRCKNKAWIFERVSGATLVGNNTKILPKKVTRDICQQKCLQEKSLNCKSMKFRTSEERKNNLTLGTCILSKSSRHIMPYSYRASNYQDEYIDNLCSKENDNSFCSYEEYENCINKNSDVKFLNRTKEECQKKCETTPFFPCRGFSLIPTNSNTFICLIHGEDTKIYGPSSLKYMSGGSYFERATCLNITVTCTEKLMTIKFTPEMDFKGKLYLQGFSEDSECYSVGNGYRAVMLKIPLISHHCGLTEARSKGELHRTLLSANMLLQYNPLIQAQGDRLIRVGCIFSNDSSIVIGTSVNLTENVNNKGSTVINSSSHQPIVNLEVIDLLTQSEATDVQIGQELQLKIEVTPIDGFYDVWAGHLVAMTENGADSILLLDDRGCPTNLRIFPSLQQFDNGTTKILFANFQAFKFTSSPIVRFSIIVEFCPGKCPLVNCDSNEALFGREKRYLSLLQTVNGTTVKNINRQQFHENDNQDIIKMPLDFVIVVRNNKQLKPDKLLYGENRILVAGYDFINNEVCFDYFLLVGLIIVWILIQVVLVVCSFLIIRKYKRHYEEEYVRHSIDEIQKSFRFGDNNLDSRRVHWADHRDNDSDYL